MCWGWRRLIPCPYPVRSRPVCKGDLSEAIRSGAETVWLVLRNDSL